MDPVSALSVAAAAIQFLDFSVRCLAGITAVYRSIDSGGSLTDYSDILGTAEMLRSSSTRLRESLSQDMLRRPPTKSEQQVIAVSTQCADIANDLIRTVSPFPPSDLTAASVVNKIYASFKALLNAKTVQTLQQKIRDVREELVYIVLLDLR